MHIELEGLSKAFGPVSALKEFDITIPDSSIIALLGKNGAGKSTLLKILAGLLVPDKGTIRYDGQNFSRENLDLRKRLYFTPDIPLLFPDHTSAWNISTLTKLYGKSIQGREEHLTYWLEETGCAALINRTVGLLSRGQVWKVNLGCVAAIEPELWLVDEPFASGMDAIGMAAFRQLATHLSKQGSTIIYTTQMVEMAVDFSDHVCVIREGDKTLWSPSSELRSRIDMDPEAAKHILLADRNFR
ncbi:ATP-binding cassette domain-containing protein [Luteolibacter algae]|uniref:ATP-binding cassette domain-containing protein n=1 Tax=Luteolibacter algae TaxID=454151 RepID=A0ABW5D679_9BACT